MIVTAFRKLKDPLFNGVRGFHNRIKVFHNEKTGETRTVAYGRDKHGRFSKSVCIEYYRLPQGVSHARP